MTDTTAEKVEALEKLNTKQIMAWEMEIKRAAVTQVRRFFYGPTLRPTLREQALHFVSFGTIIKMEWLCHEDRPWN